MPPVRRLTDAYRASAVLTVGLELHRRTDRLDRERRDLGAQASDARDFFNRRRRLTSELAERTTRASEIVSASYADPRAADRFRSLLERHGYEHAANLLERDPARLGRLRGTAITGLSYHPNLMVYQVAHGNGVTDTQARDPNFIHRPLSISWRTQGKTAQVRMDCDCSGVPMSIPQNHACANIDSLPYLNEIACRHASAPR